MIANILIHLIVFFCLMVLCIIIFKGIITIIPLAKEIMEDYKEKRWFDRRIKEYDEEEEKNRRTIMENKF